MVELRDKEYMRKKSREWYERNKDKHKASTRARQKANPEKIREYVKNARLRNPSKALLNGAKSRAKLHSLDFNLELEDIIIPTHCPYLGMELIPSSDGYRKASSPSLDRIDPTKGYVKGNVQVISDLANRMKQNATIEELILFAEGVIKVHGRAESNKTTT